MADLFELPASIWDIPPLAVPCRLVRPGMYRRECSGAMLATGSVFSTVNLYIQWLAFSLNLKLTTNLNRCMLQIT